MRLYLDASAIIYVVEGDLQRRRHVENAIAAANAEGDGVILTSELSRLECRVKPIRVNDLDLLADYDSMLDGSRYLVAPVSRTIIDEATRLRAQHGFKMPDAIHLATALICGADRVLTGDRDMTRCPGIHVELVSS